jgi:YfiH family protein
MIAAPGFDGLPWLVHGFGVRDSAYPKGIVTVRQIHSNIVLDAAQIRAAENLDGGGPDACRPVDADALISDTPGVLVGVRTADCVPILLVDTTTRVVAAVHAGWRGTVENIAAATVRAMTAGWGTRPADVRAAIGPSIGVCCYEVGPEVGQRFGLVTHGLRGPEAVYVDLPQANERQLRALGVTNIWKSGLCTFCTADRFFSFRRKPEDAGRMISFIGQRPVFADQTKAE